MSRPDETRNLLAHVAARLGGIEELAQRVRIDEQTLRGFLVGREPIPDTLLPRLVDLILEDIDRLTGAGPTAAPYPADSQNKLAS